MSYFQVKNGLIIDDSSNVIYSVTAPNNAKYAAYTWIKSSTNEVFTSSGSGLTASWTVVAGESQQIDALGTNVGTLLYTEGQASGIVDGETLTSSVEKLDLEIGAAVIGSNVLSDTAINLNMNAIDAEIGAAVSNETRTQSPLSDQAINLNITALDAAIGSDADITNINYIQKDSVDDSVHLNLSRLDGQVKTNETAIGSLTTGLLWTTEVDYVTDINISVTGTGSMANTTALIVIVTDLSTTTGPFADGTTIFSSFDNIVYTTQAGAWAASTALSNGNTFFTGIDATDSPANQEGGAAYTISGGSPVKVADFDFEVASGIGTAAFTGSVLSNAVSDVYTQMQALGVDLDALQSASGITAEATSLGVFTGTTIADTQTIKVALQSLETELESSETALIGVTAGAANIGTFSGTIISDNGDIKTALQELETDLESVTSSGGTVTTLVDATTSAFTLAAGKSAKFFIEVDNGATGSYASEMLVTNGTGSTHDVTEYAIVSVGTDPLVSITVSSAGTEIGLNIDVTAGTIKVKQVNIA